MSRVIAWLDLHALALIYRSCQLPDCVTSADGYVLHRPQEWK